MKSAPLPRFALLLLLGGALGLQPIPTSATHTDPDAPAYSWPAADFDRDGVYDRVDHCPGTAAGVEVDRYGCPMTEAAVRAQRPVAAYPPGIRGRYASQLMRHGRIRLDMAFFETDRAELRPYARRALREVAEVIRRSPTLKFEIAGHADSRGSDEHNRDLSLRRARAVRRYLVERCDVRPIQLVARGFGESRLATAERDDFEYQANRRVEFRCVNPEAMARGSRIDSRDAAETLAAQQGSGESTALLAAR